MGFIPKKFDPFNWKQVKGFLDELGARPLDTKKQVEKFLRDRSELFNISGETLAWTYIRTTRNTKDQKAKKDYTTLLKNIVEKSAPYSFELDKKLVRSKGFKRLPDSKYLNLKRIVKNNLQMYCEKNVPLETKVSIMSKKYRSIVGSLSVDFNGKVHTLQQMKKYLLEQDRDLRKKAFSAMWKVRLSQKKRLEDLFDRLLSLRNTIAKNAKYKNFRDYMHRKKGRFDYTVKDCFRFHESIKKVVVPIYNHLLAEREKALGVKKLKPWDNLVNIYGEKPLKPFSSEGELINGCIRILKKIDPRIANNIEYMKKRKFLDLASRQNKAPGGYNYPLSVTKRAFIFMNATGLAGDITTLLHESGHATHTYQHRKQDIPEYNEHPAEVSELASMAMELITMDYWDIFYKRSEELKRAKIKHIEDIISILPWISSIDLFQQWIYTHKNHTREAREKAWNKIMRQYGGNIDWTGNEKIRSYFWHKQLHIFQYPFYYIEYGIAQIGAIQIWMNFERNPKVAIRKYLRALELGYSKPVPEIYRTAGIKFDFSTKVIQKCIGFLVKKLNQINS